MNSPTFGPGTRPPFPPGPNRAQGTGIAPTWHGIARAASRKDTTMTYATDTTRPGLVAGIADADLAALILRVAMGILFLAHTWLKLVIFTPAGTAAFFESLGFPGFLAYLVIAAELLGGIALILGLWTRWVSLALVPVLLGSIYAPHGAAGFFFSSEGGGWEFPAFWAVALVVQALLGDGAFALRRGR
ncbi:DoxX family protein [Ruixingdingia sedimenti]|uniref:DoxX family protein n=1 Tax=Ruixingdingia sedimenti TaxID=3073604 RepID=A0ABU1F465_9RHOB|nr:DoxX family protein [Xinfangfangia sp. LG-4]MDR5651458.1 DoxX family protein [Xinfangfangia sp. LG-4]